MIYKKVIAYSISPFCVAMLREQLASKSSLILEEMVNRYGLNAVWEVSWQLMQDFMFQFSTNKVREAGLPLTMIDNFFPFFKDLADMMPKGTIDSMVELLEQFELRQEFEENFGNSVINKYKVYKDLIALLKDSLSQESLARLERRQLLNGLRRHDSTIHFPTESTPEYVKIKQFVQICDGLFKGEKVRDFETFSQYLGFGLNDISSDLRTAMVFYLLKRGYGHVSNHKQLKLLFNQVIRTLSFLDKVQAILYILHIDERQENKSVYTKNAAHAGKKFIKLLEELGINSGVEEILNLFSIFSTGYMHQKKMLLAYMREFCINTEENRLSLSEILKRLELIESKTVKENPEEPKIYDIHTGEEVQNQEMLQIQELFKSGNDSGANLLLGVMQSSSLVVRSFVTTELLCSYSVDVIETVWRLASIMSMTVDNSVEELMEVIFDSIKDVDSEQQVNALKLISTLYLEGGDINDILEIISSNPKIYKASVVEFIGNADLVLKVETLAQQEGKSFFEVYIKLLNVVINSSEKVTATNIDEFFEFIKQSGGNTSDITIENLLKYLKTIQTLCAVTSPADIVEKEMERKRQTNREDVVLTFRKNASLAIACIVKNIMKADNLPLDEAINRIQPSRILSEGNLHSRLFKLNVCIPLLESGWALEDIEQLPFQQIVGNNKFIFDLDASSMATLMAGCRNQQEVQLVITRVSNGIVDFVDDVGKKIVQMQHGFHEAGEVAMMAGAHAANVRNIPQLREEALKIVSVMLANGILVDDIFGDNKNGLIFRLGVNATNVHLDSSKEYSQLCLAWSRNTYLRHNQHATIQLQRLATTNVKATLLKKLIELVEQSGKNNPQKVVELTAMITGFYALKRKEKEANPMDALLEELDITDLHRLQTQDKSKAKEVFLGGIDGDLATMLNAWREKLIDVFSAEYEIPKEVFQESTLTNEKLQEALMYFSLLGSNQKIRSQNKLMFKYLVIVELLGKTKEVKSGIVQKEILEKYIPASQRAVFAQMNFKNFPFIGDKEIMDVWLAEGQKNVLVNQTMVSPSQEVNNILHLVESAIDHLTVDFKKARRGYEGIKDLAAYKKTLAGFGRDLSRAISAGSTQNASVVCPEIPANFIGKDLQETYNRVVARQRQVSLYDSLDDLVKAREVFFEFLGKVDHVLDGIEGHKGLLDAIGYKMTYSPGIFMWTGELQLLRKRLEKPETKAIIEQNGLQLEAEELQTIIKEFDVVRKQTYKFIDSYKDQIEKVIKRLQELNETEAVNQLGNAVAVIESSKQATSQVYSIMDLTSIFRILAVLKEDNTCLSPTSTINPHTNLSFLDPNRKMLAVMDENGHLVSNMLLTLGYFNNIPCLLMDNIYSKNNPTQYYPAIIQYLLEKFEKIGLPIVVTDKVRGSKEIGLGIDVNKSDIELPKPLHGSGYHESNGAYTAYQNVLRFQGDSIVFYPNFNFRVVKKGAILRKLERTAYYDIFRGVVGTDSLYRMEFNKENDDSYDLTVRDVVEGTGTTTIKVNIDEVHRQDGTIAMQIGLEIQRKDEEKPDGTSAKLYPGQTHKGGSLKMILQLFKNLQHFAAEHKFDMLMADPEFYQTYVLLKRAGFQFDPQAELTPHYEELLKSLDEAFKENKIRGIRERSEMIQEGKITIGDEVFHWPEEDQRIFMIYPFGEKAPNPEVP